MDLIFSAARRAIVLLFLAIGLSALPAHAQRVQTPSDLEERDERPIYRFDKHGGVVFREFATEDGSEPLELNCDIYVPRGDGPFPAILAVHGGAWRSGSKLNLFRHARVLAKAGYVVVAINYRLAPKHKFPAQIHDVKYAVSWMRKNASEYKIDVDRIGAWGYSAGGHLVSLLGVTDAEDGFDDDLPEDLKEYSTHVSVVVAGGAPCYLGWVPSDANTLAYWLGGSRNSDPDVYRRAEPLTYADENDPPFFLFHGTNDHLVPVRGSKRFHQKLESLGVTSEFFEYLGQGHLATFNDMSTLDRSIDFLDAVLKPDSSPDGNKQ